MEKVELQTADIAAENAAKLAELFPDIVTEVLDEAGNVRHSIEGLRTFSCTSYTG